MSPATEPVSPCAALPEARTPGDSARAACGEWRTPAIVAALLVVAIYAGAANFRWSEGPEASPFGGDFLQEWIGGYVVRAGDATRFYDPAYAQQLEHDPQICPQVWNPQEYLPLVYPPFYYAAVAPLSLLPLVTAAWLWAGLMVAALGASLGLLAQELPVAHRQAAGDTRDDATTGGSPAAHWLPWLLPAAVLFLPVVESLISSQKGTLCLLIVTATYVLLRRGQAFWAGVAFGLIAFKPQLGLVIGGAMLATGQWRFVAGAAVSVGVLALASLAVGLDVCRQYVDFARQAGEYMRTAGYDLHKSHTVIGFFALLGGDRPSLAVTFFSTAAALSVVALAVRLVGGGIDPARPRFPRQFAGLVLATILLSPHLFTYDLALLLLPLALLVGEQAAVAATGAPPERLALARWLLVGLYFVPGLSASVAASVGLQLSVPFLLAVLAWLAFDRETVPSPTTAAAPDLAAS